MNFLVNSILIPLTALWLVGFGYAFMLKKHGWYKAQTQKYLQKFLGWIIKQIKQRPQFFGGVAVGIVLTLLATGRL